MPVIVENQISSGPLAAYQKLSLPLVPHLAALEEFLEGQVREFEPEVQPLAAYCLRNAGKRLRPMLVFHAGWRVGGAVEADLVRAAAIMELVHIATLVHDDILDAAKTRHQVESAARRFGANAAVLLGDALFAHALKLASDFPTTGVCRVVSTATRNVCAGEISQTFQCGNPNVDVEDYFRIIERKTAELFRVSCALGAMLGGYDRALVEACGQFGRHFGLAYQIMDDLADFFGREERLGKTLGADLADGRCTLPLILLLQKVGPDEAEKLRRQIEIHNDGMGLFRRRIIETGAMQEAMRFFESEIAAATLSLSEYANMPPACRLKDFCHFLQNEAATIAK